MRDRKYSDSMLKKTKCCVDGCTNMSRYQWSICACGGKWMPMCSDHDLEINQMVLEWSQIKGWKGKLQKYRSRVRQERWTTEGQL